MEEWGCRTSQATPRRQRPQADHSNSNPIITTSTRRARAYPNKDTNRHPSTGGNAELGKKSVKCFGCHRKGHVVGECPDKKNKESAQMIHAEGATHLPNTEEAITDP